MKLETNIMVPLINMNFYNVSLDLVFITTPNIDGFDDLLQNNLYDNDLIKTMDSAMQGALNGYRNNEMILRSVELKTNTATENLKRIEVFRLTLRCIKHWSKKHGLNSNKIGYLGGIGWAILVAKICQMFPKLPPARLLEKFFYVYGYEWEWDKWIVRIEGLETEALEKQELEKLEKTQIKFNVITPAYPQSCATHNTSQVTKDVILSCMRDGHEIVKGILDGNDEGSEDEYFYITQENEQNYKNKWNVLFKEFTFFEKYNHFIEVNVLGENDNDFNQWKGFIEAKIRHTAKYFEDLSKMYKLKVQYWPHFYESVASIKGGWRNAATMYIGNLIFLLARG
jgi:poly(A) polymerase